MGFNIRTAQIIGTADPEASAQGLKNGRGMLNNPDNTPRDPKAEARNR
jgi:hypothetical protein